MSKFVNCLCRAIVKGKKAKLIEMELMVLEPELCMDNKRVNQLEGECPPSSSLSAQIRLSIATDRD